QGDMKLMGEGVQAQNVQIGGGVLFKAASLNFESLSSGDVNSIIGLVVWSVVFFVGALIVFFVGKMIKWIGEDRKRQDRAAK
ncbi:MAG: hypothetical protein SV760_00995, partial [Halobacteria archaeon]|nr:hypothetical protein [Halobacteria archaeon]